MREELEEAPHWSQNLVGSWIECDWQRGKSVSVGRKAQGSHPGRNPEKQRDKSRVAQESPQGLD